ncbi:MAG: cell division protein FtsA [Acidobacteria bacterium]|nr:cell division protein FtsA [Acidobacteriota bacterium]
MTKETHIVGLDLGTSNITAVIAEMNADGQPEVMGMGVAASRGVRKGVVVNPEAAAEPIRRAVEEAERMSGLTVESVYVSMSGPLLRGINNNGIIAITSPERRITRADIRRVIETACVVTLPGGHEIIDVQPQEYIVDGQDGISDPIDMLGTRLEVSAHIITGPITVRQNVITAVNRAGLLVTGVVLEPIAAAEAVLTSDEREYGSVVINIGSETTSLAVYQRGAVQHTAIFPLGGSHFTNDIAFGVRTPIPEAERIKRDFGCVLSALVVSEGHHVIEVPSMSHRPPRSLSREILCDILQPRAEEILNHVHDELRRSGFDRQLSSGAILTGGGALLRGLSELAEQIFDCPARLGYPLCVSGMTEDINTPLLATAIGLVVVATRGGGTCYYSAQQNSGRLMARTATRMKHWLGNLF